MSFSRKVRRNIRNQQRKAIGKYLQARARELNAQRKVEQKPIGQIVYTSQDYSPWELTNA